MPEPAISYIRKGDDQKRTSGIERPEVQRFAINQFAEKAGFEIGERFVEANSLGQSEALRERPALRKAIDRARQSQHPIIVARIDCLSCNTNVLTELMAHDVAFMIAELDIGTGPFVLQPYHHATSAAGNELGKKIGKGRLAAKTKGVEIGRYGREVLAPRNRKAANERAGALAHVVKPKLAAGKSLRRIVDELNHEGVPTARGGRWHLASVQRLLARLETL